MNGRDEDAHSMGMSSVRSPRSSRDRQALKDAASKVAAMSTEEWLKITGEYVAKYKDLINAGERVLPVTLRGLRHAGARYEALRNLPTKKRWFGGATKEEKEKQILETLVTCFRTCPKLQVAVRPEERSGGMFDAGALADESPRNGVLDLSGFNGLKSLELVHVSVDDVVNPPVGVRELFLEAAKLPLQKFHSDGAGEAMQTLKIRDNAGLRWEDLQVFHESLRYLSIANSLSAPAAVFGKELVWFALTEVRLVDNEFTTLDEQSFSHLPVLTKLTLKRNGLKRLCSLRECKALTSVNLSGNVIERLDNVAAIFPDSITELDVSANSIRPCPDSLGQLPRLCRVNLAKNLLDTWSDVYRLIQSMKDLTHLTLQANPMLMELEFGEYRPLVAGFLPLQKWDDFILDNRALVGDDITRKTVCAVGEKYARFQTMAVRATAAVAASAAAATALAVLHLAADAAAAARKQKKRYRTVRVRKGTAGRSETASTAFAPGSPGSVLGISLIGSSAGSPVQTPRSPSVGVHTPSALWPTGSPSSPFVRGVRGTEFPSASAGNSHGVTPPAAASPGRLVRGDRGNTSLMSMGMGSSEQSGMGKYLDNIVSSARRESVMEAQQHRRSIAAEAAVQYSLDSEYARDNTTLDFRTVITELAADIEFFMTSPPQPSVSRINPFENRWGNVYTPLEPVEEGYTTPFEVLFKPKHSSPQAQDAPKYLVAMDICFTDQTTYIRLRCGGGSAGSCCSPSESAPVFSPEDVLEDDAAGITGWGDKGAFGFEDASGSLSPTSLEGAGGRGLPAGALVDSAGFRTVATVAYPGYAANHDPPVEAVNLCNVKPWETGEAKPWNPKHVVVPATANHQYVTTHAGTTYLQRHLQAEIRSTFHPASDYALVAGFEVPNLDCQMCVVEELKKRLEDCMDNPQWPLTSGMRSPARANVQAIAMYDERFRQELQNVREISVEEQRAGSRLLLEGTTDTFMHFNSALQGVRQPDELLLEQHGLSPEQYKLHRRAHDETSDSLEGSCYCNILLGNTAEESKEVSCWIGVTSSSTYITLDLNYDDGSKNKQPLLFVVCHDNKDLQKVEIGYGRQYMRLHYGGMSGLSHLFVPRCETTLLNILRLLMSRAPDDGGELVVHPSPFLTRQLWDAQGEMRGYHLAFMRDDELVKRREVRGKNKAIKSMAFPQDVYPLREVGGSMLPVSILMTREDIVIATDNYASWPDEENKPSRWHVEKRAPVADMTGVLLAGEGSRVHPLRFSLEFTADDADGKEQSYTWHFCAQSKPALEDIVRLLTELNKEVWKADTLAFGELDAAQEPKVKNKRRGK